MPKRLRRFIESYRGSSFPTTSEMTDGSTCVVKMRGAGNGAASLISEFLVNWISSGIGMRVPAPLLVEVPDGFPWAFGTDEFDDIVKKSGGINLGLEFIPGGVPVSAETCGHLPDALVAQVVTLDLVFANYDRFASSQNLIVDESGTYWIVDHGSCRFLFQPAANLTRRLHVGHCFAGREATVSPELLSRITPALWMNGIEHIPDSWLEEAGLERARVLESVETRIQMFAA